MDGVLTDDSQAVTGPFWLRAGSSRALVAGAISIS